MTAIIAAITALGSVIGGIVYLVKTGTWALTKTTDQKNQDVDAQAAADKKQAEATGRPV